MEVRYLNIGLFDADEQVGTKLSVYWLNVTKKFTVLASGQTDLFKFSCYNKCCSYYIHEKAAHHVNSGVQLGNELHAALLSIPDPDHGSAVRPLPELGGEVAQTDVVARLLVVRAFQSICLQLCHKTGKHGKAPF